jgi:hypothetical protein
LRFISLSVRQRWENADEVIVNGASPTLPLIAG